MKVVTDNWIGHDGSSYIVHAILVLTSGRTSQRKKSSEKKRGLGWENKHHNASTVPKTMLSRLIPMDQISWLVSDPT